MARHFSLFIPFALCAVPVFAQSVTEGFNKSNNPVNLAASFNLQNALR